MKKAIILAAGVGKRLGELTKDIPKCLLLIDSNKVLLDYSLEALKDNGITKITFVGGFEYEKLKEHILKNWSNKFDFKFIFNEKYDEYNNIYSAYLAKDIWDDETVLLNSDIIFHPDILTNLKQRAGSLEAGSRASYLVIDDTKKLLQEDMKVSVDEYAQVKEINKNLSVETSLGEYIGITYLRGLERVKFLESIENNIKNKKFDLYYEDALAHILNYVSVLPFSTQGLPWTEVDTKGDYEHAKKIARGLNKIPIS